eukprot:210689_1
MTDYYENNGLRKGISLTRYVELCKQWINVNQNENNELRVDDQYTNLFSHFSEHFKREMSAISDDTLYKELELLETLRTVGVKDGLFAQFT